MRAQPREYHPMQQELPPYIHGEIGMSLAAEAAVDWDLGALSSIIPRASSPSLPFHPS